MKVKLYTDEERYGDGVHIELEEGQIYTRQVVYLYDDQCWEIAKTQLKQLIAGIEYDLRDRETAPAESSIAYFSHDKEEDLRILGQHLEALKLVGRHWYGIGAEDTQLQKEEGGMMHA